MPDSDLYWHLDREAEEWTGRRAKEPYALSDTEVDLIRFTLAEAIAYRGTAKSC